MTPSVYPPPKPARWDRLLGISSIIISVCALVVSVLEVRQGVEAQRAAVWPYLDISVHRSSSDSLRRINLMEFNISNGGVGPAVVEAMRLTLDQKPVLHWADLLDALPGPCTTDFGSSKSDIVLPAGEKVALFVLNNSHVKCAALLEALPRIEIQIFYHSVQNESWLAYRNLRRGGKVYRQQLDECPFPDAERFVE